MTDRNKFEEMLERLINEDRAGAEELFHEIVVEQSRDIYQSMIENDEDLDESDDEDLDEAEEDELDEAEEDELDEFFDLEDEFTEEPEVGGDATDDFMADAGDDMEDDMGDDMEGMDVDEVLDELQAKFNELVDDMKDDMGDDEPEMDDMSDDEPEMDDMEDEEDEEDDEPEESFAYESDDKDDEDDDDKTEESVEKSAAEQMREYVEKVSGGGLDAQKIGGDNGANAKSVVAGKNDMGGTTANILNGGESNSGGTQGGLANPSTKEDNAGNVNVPGGKASKSLKNQPGHGAEKKGKPEQADKGAGSPLNGAPKRAK